MYENIGKKIMTLSKVVGMIVLIGCIIAWLYFLCDTNTYTSGFGTQYSKPNEDNNWLAWVFLIIGIFGYISSWPLYGFGKLVDDVAQIKEKQLPEESDT